MPKTTLLLPVALALLLCASPALAEDWERMDDFEFESILLDHPLHAELLTLTKAVEFGALEHTQLEFEMRPRDQADFVEVGGGTLQMGLSDAELERHMKACVASGSRRCEAKHFADEQPTLEVQVDPFVMDKNEVTVGQYEMCVEAGVCALSLSSCSVRTRKGWTQGAKLPYGLTDSDGPQTCVDRAEAEAYCEWVGGRLPSEPEWEWAAAGPEERIYAWGDEWKADVVHDDDTPGWNTSRSPAGIFELSGGVYEWTSGAACSYSELKSESCKKKVRGVIRGGSFLSDAAALRTTRRRFVNPDQRSSNIGFRCVMDDTALYENDLEALKVAMGVADFAAKGELVELAGVPWAAIEVAGEGVPVGAIEGPAWKARCAKPSFEGRFWGYDSEPAVVLELADGAWFWAMSTHGNCLLRWPVELEPLIVPQEPIVLTDRAAAEDEYSHHTYPYEAELVPPEGNERVLLSEAGVVIKDAQGKRKLFEFERLPYSQPWEYFDGANLSIRRLETNKLVLELSGGSVHEGCCYYNYDERSRFVVVWDWEHDVRAVLVDEGRSCEDVDEEDVQMYKVGEAVDTCEDVSVELNRDRSNLSAHHGLIRAAGLLHFASDSEGHQETLANLVNLCAVQTRQEESQWAWVMEMSDGTLVEVVSGGSFLRTEVNQSITVDELSESE